MSSENLSDVTTAETTTTTPHSTTTAQHTSSSATSSSSIATAVTWHNSTPPHNTSASVITSSVTSTSSYSRSPGESEEHIAIICGVVFGVLALASALVALYIIARKVREKRASGDAGGHSRLENQTSKPYDPVDRDSNSFHDYRPMERAPYKVNGVNSTDKAHKEKNQSIVEVYENTDPSNRNQPSKPSIPTSECIEEYEPVTVASTKQHTYVQMSARSEGTKTSPEDIQIYNTPRSMSVVPPQDTERGDSPYVNMNDLEITRTKSNDVTKVTVDEVTYANATWDSKPVQQIAVDHNKSKIHKIGKKKDKYSLSDNYNLDSDHISYKL